MLIEESPIDRLSGRHEGCPEIPRYRRFSIHCPGGLSPFHPRSHVLRKPVIASNIGGVKEIIEEGVNGVLVEPNRPEQITEKILYLFEHQDDL